ncbi:exonuclease [Vibrio phage D528]
MLNQITSNWMLGVMDSETLDRWDDAVVLSVATTIADLRQPLTFTQLVNEHTHFMKFDAKEQRVAGRKFNPKIMDEFWKNDKKTCEIARRVSLYPDPTREYKMGDFRDSFLRFCNERGVNAKDMAICDRNLFDLRKMQHIIEVTLGEYGSEPWHYHNIFNITDVFLAHGFDRYMGINPYELQKDPMFEGMFIYHDPSNDAALDWLRFQKFLVEIGLLEVAGDPKAYHNGLYYSVRGE